MYSGEDETQTLSRVTQQFENTLQQEFPKLKLRNLNE
jgi:hypothetical protein